MTPSQMLDVVRIWLSGHVECDVSRMVLLPLELLEPCEALVVICNNQSPMKNLLFVLPYLLFHVTTIFIQIRGTDDKDLQCLVRYSPCNHRTQGSSWPFVLSGPLSFSVISYPCTVFISFVQVFGLCHAFPIFHLIFNHVMKTMALITEYIR